MMDIQEVFKDPEFHALPVEEKRKFMARADSDFANLPGPEQDNFLNKIAQPKKSIGGFVSNVGTNVVDVAKGLGTAVTHPFRTAGNIGETAGQIIRGGLEKIIGEPATPEAREMFEKVSKPVVKAVRNPVQIPGMAFDYLYEKPVDVAMLASGGLGLTGKVAKVGGLTKTAKVLETAARVTDPLTVPLKAAKPVVGAVRKVAKETTGALTGGGPGFIEEAAKGNQAFTKAMRGKLTGEEVVAHAKDALQNLRDQRGRAYVNELVKVRATPGVFAQVRSSLDQELTKLMGADEFQIGTITTPTGATKFDFRQSPLVKNQAVVKRAMEDIVGWQDNSALGLDNLKKRLSKYIDQVEKQSPAEVFLTRLEKKLSTGLKGAIPDYERMTRGYSQATNLIKDIESNLMLRKQGMTGRITADNTLRRLSSALRENFEMRKDLMQILGNKSGVEVPAEVAGYVANQWIPRGAWGKVLAGSGMYYLKAINPKLWPVILASSPRVVGEFLNAYGKAARKVGGPIRKGARIVKRPEVLAPLGLAGRVEEPPPEHSRYEEAMVERPPVEHSKYESE